VCVRFFARLYTLITIWQILHSHSPHQSSYTHLKFDFSIFLDSNEVSFAKILVDKAESKTTTQTKIWNIYIRAQSQSQMCEDLYSLLWFSFPYTNIKFSYIFDRLSSEFESARNLQKLLFTFTDNFPYLAYMVYSTHGRNIFNFQNLTKTYYLLCLLWNLANKVLC
jgi:hypothetical protein